jgi:putative phage-type endonuclease
MVISENDYDELESSVFEVLDYCLFQEIEYDQEDIINSFIPDEDEDEDEEEWREIIIECISSFFTIYDDWNTPLPNPLEKKLKQLRETYQPPQRSEEWYTFRHQTLTASNLWKIFKSQATLNSLIYEKCCPPSIKQISSPSLEWGQRFEPLSVKIYEKRFQTHVAEFGCIPHPRFPFLAASPDGINDDPLSPKYGTMIEVKNIVNRVITGEPKREHWIQMQIQMEVCDLDVCDFIETRFKEYENETQFYSEKESRVKGIVFIGYFVNDYTPHCHYLTNEEIHTIESLRQVTIRLMTQNAYMYNKLSYWYLDEFSCITVQRDTTWFNEAFPKMRETWETICLEKETGYEHRKPKSRFTPCLDLFEKEDAVAIVVTKLE